MSKRIIKKVLPEYFQDIVDGKKKYELRLNDFEIEPGDTLVLEEWTSTDHDTRQATGRVWRKKFLISAALKSKIYGLARLKSKKRVFR